MLVELSSTYGDRFKYASMEYDNIASQYYDRARYFISAMGRFETQDPTMFHGKDDNFYRYSSNAPTLASDPSGEQQGLVVAGVGAGLGALGGLAGEATTQCINYYLLGGEWSPDWWLAGATGAAGGFSAGLIAGAFVDPATGIGYIMIGGTLRTIVATTASGAGTAICAKIIVSSRTPTLHIPPYQTPVGVVDDPVDNNGSRPGDPGYHPPGSSSPVEPPIDPEPLPL